MKEDIYVTDECWPAFVETSNQLIASGFTDKFGLYRKWKCTAVAADPAGNVSEYFFYTLKYVTKPLRE
ncbi:MAG: hypothetical protein IPL46_33020 [Saprospiraceae bacterium]|nr:hypothetical protein [Saprospiraceae bacterium]